METSPVRSRPRWFQITLRELLALLVLTGVVGTAYIQSRQISGLQQAIADRRAKQAPIYSGIAQGGVTRRDPHNNDGTTYVYCHGCKIEVYETFVLIYIDKTKPGISLTDSQIQFIPRDAVLSMSFQP